MRSTPKPDGEPPMTHRHLAWSLSFSAQVLACGTPSTPQPPAESHVGTGRPERQIPGLIERMLSISPGNATREDVQRQCAARAGSLIVADEGLMCSRPLSEDVADGTEFIMLSGEQVCSASISSNNIDRHRLFDQLESAMGRPDHAELRCTTEEAEAPKQSIFSWCNIPVHPSWIVRLAVSCDGAKVTLDLITHSTDDSACNSLLGDAFCRAR